MNEYAQRLEDALSGVLTPWLERCVAHVAARAGAQSPELEAAARAMASEAAPRILDDIHRLLLTDVDEQRSNPLSILRTAVRYPTAVLRAHGVAPVPRDDFARRVFPEDIYGLNPATWADVDESLQEPGLIWGAWKAKTVLDRRRAERRS